MTTNRIFTWQLILNWITRILFFSSLSVLLPTFPLYLEHIGGDKSQVGVVMGAFALGVLLFRPLVGKQIDTLGRKVILLFGVLIFIVSPIFYLFIKSVFTLIPVRIFHGLGLAAFGTASITLITDEAPLQNRGEVISYTGVVNTVAFAGGPVLGSFIQQQLGYTALFSFVSILSFTCFLISLMLKETRPHKIIKNKISYLQAVLKRRILVSFLIILLTATTHGAVMFFLPLFLYERVSINIGIFFAIYGASALLVRIIIGKMSDRVGRGPVIVIALACFTSGVFVLSKITTVDMMVLSAGLYGIGFGSLQPTLSALVADNTTEDTRGKIFSFYYGGFDLGISFAGIILGTIAEHYGIHNMFVLCSGLTLSALVIFVTLTEIDFPRSIRCAFSLQKPGKKCYVCDQFMETPPEKAEEFVIQKNKNMA
ncbi:MAG: MFS transporter [bacterium]